MPPKPKKGKRRVVVDTNVLVAGISGFKGAHVPAKYPSADVLFRWADREGFIWLVTEEILDEYKEVLKRRNVRPALIGRIINLLREQAEEITILRRCRLLLIPMRRLLPVCGRRQSGLNHNAEHEGLPPR